MNKDFLKFLDDLCNLADEYEKQQKLTSLVFLYRDTLRLAYVENDWMPFSVNIKKYIDTINNGTDNVIYFNIENQKFAYEIAVKDMRISYGVNLSSDIPVELEFKDKIDTDTINLFIKKCKAIDVMK